MASLTDNRPRSVTLVLRQLRPTAGFNLTHRRIILTPDRPISVGRSSRSEAKNLSAAGSNALFDCPVISRKHAELELKLNRWTTEMERVTITDTQSMHGTSVNGKKLQTSKPFWLQRGDTISLGEHISRADSTYDGVTVVVDRIISSTENQPISVANNKPGISVPSDSESDIFVDEDDDSVVEELHGSSAHTSPEHQTSVKPVSYPNIIDLDAEDDDDVVEIAARTTIPDTYDVSPTVAHSSDRNQQQSIFYEMTAGLTNNALDHNGMNDEDDEGEEDDVSWSNQNQFSDDDDDDDQSDESDESDDVGKADLDELAFDIDADSDNEGPEIMSSRRQPSQEIGTLGDNLAPSDAATSAPPTTFRSHYDPVRGFLPEVSIHESNDQNRKSSKPRSYEPTHSFPLAYPDLPANLGHSSKWDMGPSGFSQDLDRQAVPSASYSGYQIPYFPPVPSVASFQEPIQLPFGTFNTPTPWPPATAPAAISKPIYGPSSVADQPKSSCLPLASPVGEGVDVNASPAAEPLTNTQRPKRKAAEISIEDSIPPTKSESQDHPHLETAVATVQKRRKIKQPRTNKSFLKTAATEAGKYAAGAFVGSVGLVALLVSPLGARLADC